jgi:hypothetical protein
VKGDSDSNDKEVQIGGPADGSSDDLGNNRTSEVQKKEK